MELKSVEDLDKILSEKFGNIDQLVDEAKEKNKEKSIEDLQENYLLEGVPPNALFPIRCINCNRILGNKEKQLNEYLKAGYTVADALTAIGFPKAPQTLKTPGGKSYNTATSQCCRNQLLAYMYPNYSHRYDVSKGRQVKRIINTSTLQQVNELPRGRGNVIKNTLLNTNTDIGDITAQIEGLSLNQQFGSDTNLNDIANALSNL